jgi:lipid A 3-O-deacylase
MRTPLLLAFVLAAARTNAQAISTVGVERDIGTDRFWRLAYDNDFFAATDRYFTQGIVLEVAAPWVRRIPITRVLLTPSHAHTRYSIAYEDDGYTPTDLKVSSVLVGDRPYAGTKQLRVVALARDTLRHRRLTSSVNIGIVGQGAGGKEIQTFIHQRTGNTIPQGWSHQIRNDVILNYEAGLEQQVANYRSRVNVSAHTMARVGTYNTGTAVGATVLAGQVGSPFRANDKPSGAAFVYLKPQIHIVGYDATLQGGLFNRSSPYTVPSHDVRRLVYRQSIGAVFRRGSWYAEYYRSVVSPEFRGGLVQQSGGFVIGRGGGR